MCLAEVPGTGQDNVISFGHWLGYFSLVIGHISMVG